MSFLRKTPFLRIYLCDDDHTICVLFRWQSGHGEHNFVDGGALESVVLGKGLGLCLIAKDDVNILDNVLELLLEELLDKRRRQVKCENLKLHIIF